MALLGAKEKKGERKGENEGGVRGMRVKVNNL